MLKPTKSNECKNTKQYYSIAKICFYIIVFNIVVRLDLWVSIAGLIVLLPYLLQRLLLKKIDTAKYLSLFNHYIHTFKNVHQQPRYRKDYKSSIMPEQTLDQTEFTEMDFIEPSFEEIWQDYQQTHQDNDENYKDFFQ